jgi:hypothetical protein
MIRNIHLLKPNVPVIWSLFFLCLFGCNGLDIQDKNLSSMTTETAKVVLKNFRGSYEYTVFINDEPVHSANGLSYFSWVGYPLKEGVNNITVLYSTIVNPENQIFQVRQDLLLIENDQIKSNQEIDFQIDDGKEREFVFSFNIQGSLINDSVYINDLGYINETSLRNDLREFGISIVTMLTENKFTGSAFIDNCKAEYPEWLCDQQRENIEIDGIRNKDDLEVLIGKKLALIRRNIKMSRTSNLKSLMIATNKIDDVSFSVPCLVFALVEKDWSIRGKGNRYTPIANFVVP